MCALQSKWLVRLTPVVLYLFLLFNGVLGLRFGRHWDEGIFISEAAEALQSHRHLPHHYMYPSFGYDVVLGAAGIYQAMGGVTEVKALAANENFHVYVRFVFLAISSLVVVWVYVLTFKVTKGYLASLVAGLIIGSSFEFSYHSRWAVSDCLAAQFAVLSTAILFFEVGRGKKLVFSALVAGVAAGTKYTAGMVCLNILIFILQPVMGRKTTWKTVLQELGLSGFFAALGFVLTTPGAILEWVQFIVDLGYQHNVYANGHYGHTVVPGLEHFRLICVYTGLVLFSKYALVSLLVLVLALAGTAAAARAKEWDILGLYLVVTVYVFYVSTFRVMIVRNLFYILPYFAVLAGIGFDWAGRWFKEKRRVGMFQSVVVLLLLLSCGRVTGAALTIWNKQDLDLGRELKKYLAENSNKQFVFSAGTAALLHVAPPTKALASNTAYYVFLKSEKPQWEYQANHYHQFERVIGIEDVNFDYYPDWSGDERIIILKNGMR